MRNVIDGTREKLKFHITQNDMWHLTYAQDENGKFNSIMTR